MKKLADTSTEQWLAGLERALDARAEQLGDAADERLGDVEEASRPDGNAWPELERLARGELPAPRLRELEAQSGTDPELLRALAAYRPLDRKLIDGIGERVWSAGAASGPREVLGGPVSTPMRSLSPPSGSSEQGRAARSRAWLTWGGAPVLAAAAALLLWVRPPAVVPLGEYRVEVAGALAESRGDAPEQGALAPARQGEAPSLRALPGARLEVVVRPAVADPAAVDAHVFLERAGERRSIAATIARAGSGAMRLSLELPLSGVGAGGSELVVIVSRPGITLPTALEARQERGVGWQRFRFVLVEAPGGP